MIQHTGATITRGRAIKLEGMKMTFECKNGHIQSTDYSKQSISPQGVEFLFSHYQKGLSLFCRECKKDIIIEKKRKRTI